MHLAPLTVLTVVVGHSVTFPLWMEQPEVVKRCLSAFSPLQEHSAAPSKYITDTHVRADHESLHEYCFFNNMTIAICLDQRG